MLPSSVGGVSALTVISVRFEQPKKARFLILVTLSGKDNPGKSVISRKSANYNLHHASRNSDHFADFHKNYRD